MTCGCVKFSMLDLFKYILNIQYIKSIKCQFLTCCRITSIMNNTVKLVAHRNENINSEVIYYRRLYSTGWQVIMYKIQTGYTGKITHPYPFKYAPYFAVGIASNRSGSSYTRETSIQDNSKTSFSIANFSAGSAVSGQGGCVIFAHVFQ